MMSTTDNLLKCNNKLLAFGHRHYAYINQIFGDQTVREIIWEVFPSSDGYRFVAEPGQAEFADSHHHVLYRGPDKAWCSAMNEYQHIGINVNDTLCQSYSLCEYFGRPLIKMVLEGKTMKDIREKNRDINIQNQLTMVKLYREIMHDDRPGGFLDTIKQQILYKGAKKIWKSPPNKDGKSKLMEMNFSQIKTAILKVLDDWENYGYWYFIGLGKCDSTNFDSIMEGIASHSAAHTVKIRSMSRSRSRSRSRSIST